MLKRIMRVIMAMVLTVTAFGVGGCSDANSNVTVWTVDATQKILKDISYDLTNVQKQITVKSARNEYEGWQIILTAGENTQTLSYDVSISDLTSQDGQVYSSSNISLYNELYLDVTPKEYYTETGLYPDAIVPFESAKKFGENVVSAKENQAVYVEFFVPEQQPAGVYSGTATVTVGGAKTTLPVTLNVWDFGVSEKTTAKSMFLANWDFYLGELDSTQEMYEKYVDAMLEYRLCPKDLLLENNHSNECIEQFTDLAYKYACDERCSTISIPFKQENYQDKNPDGDYTYQGKPVKIKYTFSAEVFENYVVALAKKSAETGVNILEKCVVYFTIIDEPQLHDSQARVKHVSEKFENEKQRLANLILNDGSITEANGVTKAELASAIRNISNIVTAYYEEEYVGYEIDYCPTPDYYDTQGMREKYQDNERWWYCCVGPNNPYPTYHIDDHLLATRLLYWMGAEYDVVGNLNWGVNQYSVYGEIPEDYFQYAIHGSSQNGEGFIFYPGAKYELNAPLSSLRLQAYRDGIEEYEILNAIKQKYNELAIATGAQVDFQDVMSYLSSTLYSGTRWSTTESNFYAQRDNLAKLAEMALSNPTESVAITNIKMQGANYNLDVFATDACKIYINGTEQQASVNYDGGKLYNISVNLSGYQGREIVFSADIGGKVTEMKFDIGGEKSSYKATDTTVTAYTSQTGNNVKVENNVDGIADFAGDKVLKITATGSAQYTSQSAEMQAEFLSKLSQNIEKMQLVMYTEQALDYEISFLYKKGGVVAGKPIYNLVALGKTGVGVNYIEISNLASYNWAKFEGVSKVLITFKTSAESVIYLKEIVLTGV